MSGLTLALERCLYPLLFEGQHHHSMQYRELEETVSTVDQEDRSLSFRKGVVTRLSMWTFCIALFISSLWTDHLFAVRQKTEQKCGHIRSHKVPAGGIGWTHLKCLRLRNTKTFTGFVDRTLQG